MSSYRLARARRNAGSTARRASGFQFNGGALARLRRATRSPRRCWRTACGWSAAASSCIGRAASSPAASRSRRPSSMSARGAARTPNLRATLVELREGLRAASVNCWPSVDFDLGAVNGLFSALLPAGLLLQDLQVAELALCSSRRSGAWPASGTRHGARSRSLRGDFRRGRRAGDRRRRRPACARRRRRPRRARARPADERIRRSAARSAWRGDARWRLLAARRSARRALARAYARVRPLRSQPGVRARIAAPMRRRRHAGRGACASACGRFAPGHHRGNRRVRAADGVSGQRPAGRDARGRGRQVCAGLRRRVRAARGHRREQRFGLSGRRVAARRRGEVVALVDRRARADIDAAAADDAAASAGLKVFSEAASPASGAQGRARLHDRERGPGAHRARVRLRS